MAPHSASKRPAQGLNPDPIPGTTMFSLMDRVPDLAANAGDAAKADKDLGDVGAAIARVAPKLLKATSGFVKAKEDSAVRTALSAVVKTVDDELLDFDEVETRIATEPG